MQQLAVYNESGVQVGMTFPKRARQLINKQRALWHDDTHTSIRLLPELKEEAMDEYLNDELAIEEPPSSTATDDLLLYIARKNVREKRNFLKHLVAYVMAWPLFGLFFATVLENTRHPQHRRLGHLNWNLERLGEYTSGVENAAWVVDDINRWGQSLFNNHLTHPMFYMIVGALIAWGVWIFVRAVNMRVATRIARERKHKPDPVQMEYKRLKDMGARGY